MIVYLVHINGQIADVSTHLVGAGMRVNWHTIEANKLAPGNQVSWKIQATLTDCTPDLEPNLASIEAAGRRCTLEDINDMEDMLETLNKAGRIPKKLGWTRS